MKRPFLIATIGYSIGILWGIYIKCISPFIFSTIILLIWIHIKRKKRKNKYIRFLCEKTSNCAIILFLIALLIANIKIQERIRKNESIYNQNIVNWYIGTVISEKKENGNIGQYLIKIEQMNDKEIEGKFYLQTRQKLNYGDKILFQGEYSSPEVQRNDKGFDYRKYLRTIGIFGTIKEKDTIKVIKKDTIKGIRKVAFLFRMKIRDRIEGFFHNEKVKQILIALLIGDTSQISKEIKKDFKNSNLSHMLAISRNSHINFNFSYNICIRNRKY